MGDVIVKESAIQGLGAFAARDIAEGERMVRVDDSREVTDDNPLDPTRGEYDYHCDYLASGKVVLMQWPERHINHSCDPNAYSKRIEGVRHVLARRDIRAGEEITQDYCINSRGNTVWQCNCRSEQCRKRIHSDFFRLPLYTQIEYLPLLEEWFIQENAHLAGALRKKAQRAL